MCPFQSITYSCQCQPNIPHSQYSGQFHSVKGNLVEAVGNATGWDNWRQSGKEEHAQGEAEQTAAQARDYAEGLTDRVSGKYDAVVGAFSGDKSQQISGEWKPVIAVDEHQVEPLLFLRQCPT